MENQIKYAFRMVHVDNIPHILRGGFVCRRFSAHNSDYVSIADSMVLRRRDMVLGKRIQVEDYIPFYFGPRQPMLYVIQNGYNGVVQRSPEDIVYCVVRLDALVEGKVDCIFTDGHALSSSTSFYNGDQLVNIDGIIKYNEVYSQFWNQDNDIDLKRRKEAELLVKYYLKADFISGYVVYNDSAKNRLIERGVSAEKIAIRKDYYF